MTLGHFALVTIFFAINNLQIINTSDKNASKTIINNDDWQNWLPFKDKKRSSDVAVNAKILYKREAKFGLRIEREAQSDDYYDKGGESDSEDYYERKEWSDVYRQAHSHAKSNPIKVDHPDLVDIDGVHVKPHRGHGHRPGNGKKEKGTKSAEKTKEDQKASQTKEKKEKVRKKASSKAKREGESYSKERASAIDAFKLF